MKRADTWGAVLIVTLGGLFQGCSGKSERGVHDAGAGGGSGSGGAPSTGGVGGKGGAAGKGGVGGQGGSSAAGGKGGAAGKTGAGGTQSGAAGDGSGGEGAQPFEPECDCDFEQDGEFSCTTSVEHLAERLPLPADCSNDRSFVTRSFCIGSVSKYHFAETAWENDYELELDSESKALTYGRASGYVGSLCGLEGGDIGTITAGAPSDFSCDEECAVCTTGSYFDELPACFSCEGTPNVSSGAAVLTLEEYCSFASCPSSVSDAEERFAGSCDAPYPALEHTGCGMLIVSSSVSNPILTENFFFDQGSGALIGARRSSDYPGGPCETRFYSAGDLSAAACSSTTVCSFCAADGAAGAAGAAGDTGAGGDTGSNGLERSCPPPSIH